MRPPSVRIPLYAFPVLVTLFFSSCETQADRDKYQALVRQNDSLRTVIDSLHKAIELRERRSVAMLTDMRTGLWRIDPHRESGRLIFTTEYPNASVYEIAKALNAAFHEDSVSEFRITGVREHTVSVKVLDATRLTQGLGSTGAQEYLAQVTFSLTSVPGILDVNFEFEEGDHASPGTFDRTRFDELTK